mmetsp:Transcript_70336/g.164792  ORF Transcript_70336/g.164792 Transcript_70336/m.164792 type:complete len:222 (-) Transcript_70336:1209-1874(-)
MCRGEGSSTKTSSSAVEDGKDLFAHHHRRFGFHTCIDTDKYCVGQTALDACGYDLDTYWLDWSCCFALPFAWDPQGQHPRRLHGGASRVNDCDCIAPGFQSAPGSVRISCVFGFGSNTSCMFCDTYCSTNNLLLGTLRNDDAAWHGGADFDRRRWQLQSHGLWGYMGRAFQLHHHGRCSISGAGFLEDDCTAWTAVWRCSNGALRSNIFATTHLRCSPGAG